MDIPPAGPTARPIFATPLPGAIAPSPVPLDAAGRIDTDLPCKRCGYNLRTLMPDGRCPECATAVGRAMHGDYLKFADPAWVQKLASGINWIIGGTIIGFFLGAAIGGMLGSIGVHPNLIAVVASPIGLIPLFGYWRFTTPDPSGLQETRQWNARSVARVGLIGNYVIAALLSLVGILVPLTDLAMKLLGILVALVATIALFKLARQLAMRIPDPALEKGFRNTMWGVIVVLFLLIAVAAVGALIFQSKATTQWMQQATTASTTSTATTTTQSLLGQQIHVTHVTATTTNSSPPPPMARLGFAVAGISGCAIFVIGLILAIYLLVYVLRLRTALKLAAEQAVQTWAALPLGQNR